MPQCYNLDPVFFCMEKTNVAHNFWKEVLPFHRSIFVAVKNRKGSVVLPSSLRFLLLSLFYWIQVIQFGEVVLFVLWKVL